MNHPSLTTITQSQAADTDRLPQEAGAGCAAATDAAAAGSAHEKLVDALTPGFQAEFDPDEAEAAGAFHEDALSEADALASTADAVQSLDFAGATSSQGQPGRDTQ